MRVLGNLRISASLVVKKQMNDLAHLFRKLLRQTLTFLFYVLNGLLEHYWLQVINLHIVLFLDHPDLFPQFILVYRRSVHERHATGV